jgi:hypothetical protein
MSYNSRQDKTYSCDTILLIDYKKWICGTIFLIQAHRQIVKKIAYKI